MRLECFNIYKSYSSWGRVVEIYRRNVPGSRVIIISLIRKKLTWWSRVAAWRQKCATRNEFRPYARSPPDPFILITSVYCSKYSSRRFPAIEITTGEALLSAAAGCPGYFSKSAWRFVVHSFNSFSGASHRRGGVENSMVIYPNIFLTQFFKPLRDEKKKKQIDWVQEKRDEWIDYSGMPRIPEQIFSQKVSSCVNKIQVIVRDGPYINPNLVLDRSISPFIPRPDKPWALFFTHFF